MPSISMFFGIVVYMFYDDHNPPHFHARYQGHKAAFLFDGTLLAGEIPLKQQKILAAWAVIHAEELEANWELAAASEQLYKIDPLR